MGGEREFWCRQGGMCFCAGPVGLQPPEPRRAVMIFSRIAAVGDRSKTAKKTRGSCVPPRCRIRKWYSTVFRPGRSRVSLRYPETGATVHRDHVFFMHTAVGPPGAPISCHLESCMQQRHMQARTLLCPCPHASRMASIVRCRHRLTVRSSLLSHQQPPPLLVLSPLHADVNPISRRSIAS